MKTVICRCTQCKAARKCRTVQARINRVKASNRNLVRISLAKGNFDSLPVKNVVGYLA